MSVLTVRRLSEALYNKLKERARLHHRSLEAEVRAILEEALRDDREAVMREAASFRERVAGRYRGEALREIREGRER